MMYVVWKRVDDVCGLEGCRPCIWSRRVQTTYVVSKSADDVCGLEACGQCMWFGSVWTMYVVWKDADNILDYIQTAYIVPVNSRAISHFSCHPHVLCTSAPSSAMRFHTKKFFHLKSRQLCQKLSSLNKQPVMSLLLYNNNNSAQSTYQPKTKFGAR